MFGKSFVGLALLSLVSTALASPLVELEERAACKKKSYGAFKLYAAPVGQPASEWQQVKLIDLYTPRPLNDTISALSVCPDASCGRAPAYWVLKDQILEAVFTDAQEGWRTVNKALVKDDTVKFVTSDAASIAKQLAPVYCATRNPKTSSGLPGYLSASGSAEYFSMCTNFPTVGTPERADIYYKAVTPSTGGALERYCTKVHLVMQGIGIVPEPIPA